MKVISQNRKANFNYEIIDKYTAGMVLKGWQVKSIKANQVSLTDAFAYFNKGEIFLKGAQITPWKTMGDFEKKTASNDIKLLLNKQEIEKLASKLSTPGITLVPLKILQERGLLKVDLGLARGKRDYDKRSKIKERDQIRDIERDLKNSNYF